MEYKYHTSDIIEQTKAAYTFDSKQFYHDTAPCQDCKIMVDGHDIIGYCINKINFENDENGMLKSIRFDEGGHKDFKVNFTVDVDTVYTYNNVKLQKEGYREISLANYIIKDWPKNIFKTDALRKGELIKFRLKYNDPVCAPIYETTGYIKSIDREKINLGYRTNKGDFMSMIVRVESVDKFDWTDLEEGE